MYRSFIKKNILNSTTLEKKTIIKIVVIGAIVIGLFIVLAIFWNKIFTGKNAQDLTEVNPVDSKPVPVDMDLVKKLSQEAHTEFNSLWVSSDIMKKISLLNGQTLKALAQYYQSSYNTSFYKDVLEVNMPAYDYDEIVESRLKQLGLGN